MEGVFVMTPEIEKKLKKVKKTYHSKLIIEMLENGEQVEKDLVRAVDANCNFCESGKRMRKVRFAKQYLARKMSKKRINDLDIWNYFEGDEKT